MSLLRILAVGVAFTALSAPATADVLRNFKVANWFAGAYSDNATKQFSHCAASANYVSGIMVLFSINRNFQWSMGFANSAWRLTPGGTYDIAFLIDAGSVRHGKATAISRSHVGVNLPDSTELFSDFRRGQILRVAAAEQTFTFNLTDTSKLLPALLNCVRQEIELAQTGTNPFVKKERPGPSESERLEATTIAANLLSAAGLQKFYILPPDDPLARKFFADTVWVGPGIIGTLKVLPPGQFRRVDEIPPLLISSDAKSCKGAFFSGSSPTDGDKPMGRAFTSCNDGKKPVTTYYMITDRPKGGFYLFATIGSEGEEPAKETDSNIRSVVFTTIR